MTDETQEAGVEVVPAKKKGRPHRITTADRKYDFSCIRTLRKEKKLTIDSFAKQCGLSYAPISRIETNVIKPTLDTVDKIAIGLGMPTHLLLQMAEIRELQRQSGKTSKSGSSHMVWFHQADLRLGYGMLKRGAKLSDVDSLGAESTTVMVRSGRLRVEIRGAVHDLGPGDAATYDPSVRHEVVASDDADVVVMARRQR